MDFTCAKCGKEFVKLSGWKRHMSKEHGGWDEYDVAQVTSGTTSSEEGAQQRMSAFADTLSADSGKVETPTGEGKAPPSPQIPSPIKTIRATPKRLKKILASIPETILKNPGIELDEEDKEALEEAGEFLADIFGVEFEVDQQKKVLRSNWWAVLWVAGVTLLIYFKHRFSDVWKNIYEAYKKRMAENQEAN